MRGILQTVAPFQRLAAVKRLAAAAFGLALALFPFCATARAQAQGAAPTRDARQGAPNRRPAREAALVRQLNLTQEQRSQLREIRAQAEPEARELQRRVRLARRALDEAIYGEAADDSLVEQSARELAAAQAALIRHRSATELKVRRVLTAEQLRAFRALRQQAARRQMLQRRRARQTPPPADQP